VEERIRLSVHGQWIEPLRGTTVGSGAERGPRTCRSIATPLSPAQPPMRASQRVLGPFPSPRLSPCPLPFRASTRISARSARRRRGCSPTRAGEQGKTPLLLSRSAFHNGARKASFLG